MSLATQFRANSAHIIQVWSNRANGGRSKTFSQPEDFIVAKLPVYDFSNDPEMAAIAAQIEKSRGYVSNVLRTLAHSPQGVKQHMIYGHYLRFESDLNELQRELTICATGRDIPYAWAHHGGLLRQLGMSPEQLATLKRGEIPAGLSQSDAILCKFVFEITSGKALSEHVLKDVRSHFTDRQMMDISLITAYFIGTGALISAFEVDVEPNEILQIELDWQVKRPH